MKRTDFPAVGSIIGRLHRFEAAIKAIMHDDGAPVLSVRKGNSDLETGIVLSKDATLALLLAAIELEWTKLIAYGLERDPPQDTSIANSLRSAELRVARKNTQQSNQPETEE